MSAAPTSAPVAEGVGLPWDVEVGDAVATLRWAREQHGDTFWVHSGSDRHLFTFSAVGVESFYALREEEASKGVADYLMLRRKLPEEIFHGRRMLPADLFRRDDVATYIANLDAALDATRDELGASGEIDVFALTRRLAHRMGLASWAGPGCVDGPAFDRLVAAFDDLDGAESFVRPDLMQVVAESDYARERAALRVVESEIGESIARPGGSGLFQRIVAGWTEVPEQAAVGVARDVALIHVASMSNLASALGWLIVDLLEHPEAAERVRSGDREFTDRCALESIRLAQRSIMTRAVMKPISFDTGEAVHELRPGTLISTLLPITNRDPALGVGDEGPEAWDPQRWSRYRLTHADRLASRALVTAFGHGRHSCPAQPFSLDAMALAATRLLAHYRWTPKWHHRPEPLPTQVGGIARASGPSVVAYAAEV